jgi:hypothetical protein
MAPRTPVPPALEEKAAPILKEAVERREPERLFKPQQDGGGTALAYTVSFWTRPRFETHSDFESRGEERTPAAFGVLVTDDQVLTQIAPQRLLPAGHEGHIVHEQDEPERLRAFHDGHGAEMYAPAFEFHD